MTNDTRCPLLSLLCFLRSQILNCKLQVAIMSQIAFGFSAAVGVTAHVRVRM